MHLIVGVAFSEEICTSVLVNYAILVFLKLKLRGVKEPCVG